MSLELEKNQLEILLECKGDIKNIQEYINDLKKLKEKIDKNRDFINILKVNKVLSDKNRLLILGMLLEQEEMCICEFSIALNLTQPTISHHLKKLEDAGLIEGEKSGKFVHYRIVKSRIKDYIDLLSNFIKIPID
ncbi:MAG: ArsR/SmtB family transcription factor [Candidatus Helarchaeota archaeon]